MFDLHQETRRLQAENEAMMRELNALREQGAVSGLMRPTGSFHANIGSTGQQGQPAAAIASSSKNVQSFILFNFWIGS